MQSISLANNEDDNNANRPNTTASQLITNLATLSTSLLPNKTSNSLLAKLTDARKTLFGKANTPEPAFSSANENKAFLSYITSEPEPELKIIEEFEDKGAQLNAVTEDGNNAIHLLARADQRSEESMNIVDYLIRKGCDPNRQNDYGWTPGIDFYSSNYEFHL
jgi:ankyrin repeat protein